MIAHVSGVVAEKFGNAIIVDVNGVGYEVQVAVLDFDNSVLGEQVKFHT
jgi:Holliday junction resolvasome RuvABC DNA-binding subunit